MKRLFLVPALLFFVVARAAAPESQLTALAQLAGHCWEGEFAEGGSWDRHCFQWLYDGKFLRDTHVVTGKRGPYGGETLYRFDAAAKKIVFHYFDSSGGYSSGEVQPQTDRLLFPEERYQDGAKERVLRTIWRFEAVNRFVATTEERVGEKWIPAWSVTYIRK